MSAQLYDVWSPLLCLPTCFISSYSYMYDICSTVWCLPACMMFSYLYDICLPEWCLLNCMMSAYLYDVCFTVCCLPTVRLWCLLYCTCMMSTYLYDVCWILCSNVSYFWQKSNPLTGYAKNLGYKTGTWKILTKIFFHSPPIFLQPLLSSIPLHFSS